MKNCLIKSLIIYLIIIVILCKIRPNFFNKEWNLYFKTNDINDLITLPSVFVLSSVFSILLSRII